MPPNPGSGEREPDGGTRLVRISADLAEMLSGIYDVTKVPAANYLDPLIRAHITADYQDMKQAIEAIKKARAKHKKPDDEGSEPKAGKSSS